MRGQRNIGYSSLGVPPENAYPFPNGSVGQAPLSCPLFGGFGDAVDRDLNVGVFVSGLLMFGRPPAIFEGIPSVVVDAIKLQARRKASVHVGNEVSNFEPPFADINSTAAVSVPSLVVRVFTPPDHGFPNWIQAVISEAVGSVNQCLAPSVRDDRDSSKLN